MLEKCQKCKGKRLLHIADKIAFAGDKSHFSLAYLSEAAKISGLRVFGTSDSLDMLITKRINVVSSSITKAKKMGVLILTPDLFEKELTRICDGNIVNKRNPSLKRAIQDGGKVYPIGLNREEERVFLTFLEKNDLLLAHKRVPTVIAAISSTTLLNSGDAKVLMSMGVPVYNYNRVLPTLLA